MGVSSMATATDGVQFCVFDLQRGQQEGQEIDKILYFYPSDCPYPAQLSVTGLCEGMITFTRIFSPDADCEVIEAEKHSYVFYQAEPDIWMVMVVEKNKDPDSTCRFNPLQSILKDVHSLFTMFNGSLRALLEKQPSGELARSYLYSFVTDYLTDFRVGKRIQMPSYRQSLKEWRSVQMLTIPREIAIEVQSLVTAIGSSFAGSTMCSSMILFQDLLVATTLSPDDTVNMFKFAILRLTPHALSSNTTSWSYFRKGFTVANAATGSNSSPVESASDENHNGSRDTSPGRQNQRYLIPRPLQRNKLSRGKDGFFVGDTWGGEVGSLASLTPVVWLQQADEQMHLCVYQHKSLTIILLVPLSSLIDGEQSISLLKKQLLENALQKIVLVEEKLTRAWGGENAYHVSGYRYLIIDNDRSISRASPAGKVATLTKDSLLLLSKLREEVDLEKSRVSREHPEKQNNFEICIRAKNNAWVIGKITRGRELYMVLEKAGETLLYAFDAVEKFSNRYCDGAFSFD